MLNWVPGSLLLNKFNRQTGVAKSYISSLFYYRTQSPSAKRQTRQI